MVQEYSLAQVKEHNNESDNWVVIHNDIYDLTAYLNEHPGGEEVLIEQAGKDASEAFEDVGHSSDAREVMKKFKIGTLIASERKAEPPKNWESTNTSGSSSLSPWIVPVVLGFIVTVIYRVYFRK